MLTVTDSPIANGVLDISQTAQRDNCSKILLEVASSVWPSLCVEKHNNLLKGTAKGRALIAMETLLVAFGAK